MPWLDTKERPMDSQPLSRRWRRKKPVRTSSETAAVQRSFPPVPKGDARRAAGQSSRRMGRSSAAGTPSWLAGEAPLRSRGRIRLRLNLPWLSPEVGVRTPSHDQRSRDKLGASRSEPPWALALERGQRIRNRQRLPLAFEEIAHLAIADRLQHPQSRSVTVRHPFRAMRVGTNNDRNPPLLHVL